MASERSPLTQSGQQHAAERARRRRLVIAFAAVVALFGAALAALLLLPGTPRSGDGAATPSSTGAGAGDNATSGGTALVDDAFYCGLTDFETGYVKLANKRDDHYFYWFVPSASATPNKDPLVLWLTGGPGAPGTLALLTENGPCIISPDNSSRLNEFAWNREAHVIWLDQPTSVGFSYSTTPEDADTDEDNVGENIYWFLQGFFDKHPELQGREFYITGESYGGHYVPAAAHFVWEQNKLKQRKAINLQGIAIGNGITNPAVQNPHYIDMVDNQYNVTLVNATQLAQMKRDAVTCGELMKPCSKANVTACREGSDFCSEKLLQPLIDAKRNPYDLRMYCDKEDATQCYDMSYVSKYLDAPNVRAYLGVPAEHVGKWQECNNVVNAAFYATGDPGMDFSPYVADLLNDNVRVLIYAGDADMMCNWHGNNAWTKALEWKGKAEFNAAKEHAYVTASGVDAGVVRSHDKRFTFLRLYNSGHMVPQDQPEVALDMINKFLQNKDL